MLTLIDQYSPYIMSVLFLSIDYMQTYIWPIYVYKYIYLN